MSALRALLQSGLVISPKGWTSLDGDLRQAIAREGIRGIVDTTTVRKLMERVPPRLLKLVPKSSEPDPDVVPQNLVRALGPGRLVTVGQWRALRAVDRYVLSNLTSNTRLLWKAFDELNLGLQSAHEGLVTSRAKWIGQVAHAEVHTTASAVQLATSSRYLDGRAMILARTAGLRAARKIAETFDLLADAAPGPIELDWSIPSDGNTVVWQAHASNYDGAFFPAASLLAAVTAATALHDMIREQDPKATLSSGSLRDEAWLATATDTFEDATVLYSVAPTSSKRSASGNSKAPNLTEDDPSADRISNGGLVKLAVGSRLEANAAPRSSAPEMPANPVFVPNVSPLAEPSANEVRQKPKRPHQKPNQTAAILLIIAVLLFAASSALVAYVLLFTHR
jgi:molybdenum cofactor biosynthesis enzyme